MNTENCWNDTDRGKQNDSKKNLPQCHFSTNILIWNVLSSNPGLYGKRPWHSLAILLTYNKD
jgi:hypothetical protein